MLREAALDFLQRRPAKAGQTVQIGWFVFRTIDSAEGEGLDLEILDFRGVASFTRDFSIPERIHWAQTHTLKQLGEEAAECTLRQAALVSRSYHPAAPGVFIERQPPTDANDSGWYVGIADDDIDGSDSSYVHRSLYELTILDERFARFWLLPTGYRVTFGDGEPEIEKVEPEC